MKIVCSLTLWIALLSVSTRLFAQATNKIDSVGDVGIGTTSPIAKLDVSGAIGGHKIYKEVGAGQPDYSYYYLKVFKLPTVSGSPIVTFNGKISAVRSNDIGVTQCSDIYISRDYYGTVHFSQQITAASYYYGPFTPVKITDGGQDWVALFYDAHSGPGIIGWVIDGTLYQEDASLTSFTSVTSLTPIHATLSYAIRGTRIATGEFFVDGNTSVSGSILMSGGSGKVIDLQNASYIRFSDAGGSTQRAYIQHNGNDLLINPDVGNTIFSAGNLGIGTTTPSEKLSVNGNVKAKKFIVTQLGWSDYVFDKGYKLRSLDSLKTFIKDNKHLPEIPTAKEVAEKGISVGDNQALLLKKIEELTLYLLQQDEKIKTLESKIAALNKK